MVFEFVQHRSNSLVHFGEYLALYVPTVIDLIVWVTAMNVIVKFVAGIAKNSKKQ